jgi:hypothetical protein
VQNIFLTFGDSIFSEPFVAKRMLQGDQLHILKISEKYKKKEKAADP